MSYITAICGGHRGSIPSPSRPGFSSMRYGGNTSSYHVQAGPFSFLMDMGSGLSVLSDKFMREGKGFKGQHIVLISHWHWDHIQGGPFFVPFFIASNTFHFHGFAPAGMDKKEDVEHAVENLLAHQQSSPHFPVAHGSMPCKKIWPKAHQRQFSESFWYYLDENNKLVMCPDAYIGLVHETLPASLKMDPQRWVKITTIPLNHPDGCLGYRIDYMGESFVYATDDEPLMFLNKELVKHGQDADIGIFDGQYTVEQLAGICQTFGHGTPRRCVEHAKACGMKRCVIGHFDPKHDDAKLDAMLADAQAYAVEIGYTGIVEFAVEGTTWHLGEEE